GVGPADAHAPELIVDRFGPHRLNSPNDVVVASDGAIWFTDPSYGIKREDEGHPGEEEYGDRYVFRVDPDTAVAVPVVIDVEAPNGWPSRPTSRCCTSRTPPFPPPTGPRARIPRPAVRAGIRSMSTTWSRVGTPRTG